MDIDQAQNVSENSARGLTTSEISILAVIVLYQTVPGDSCALNSLIRSSSQVSDRDVRLKILLYDNTPGGRRPEWLPANIEYRSAAGNDGIAVPYNLGLDIATVESFDWLLTLDQDTTLPASFVRETSDIARQLSTRLDVAAIVPYIVEGRACISPGILRFGVWKRARENFVEISQREIRAINSSMTWRVSALRQIGGFYPLFWLDYLDHWMCHVSHRTGMKFFLAGHIKVQHEFSLRDRNARMSLIRFENYLQAQSAFHDLCKGSFAAAVLTWRLVSLLCGQILRRESADFRRITSKYLAQRLFKTRAWRIQMWKKDMRERLAIPKL